MSKKLTKEYKKNETFENVLNSLNSQLSKSQIDLFNEVKENMCTIHVIGAPRSGTTLLTQKILTYLKVGYINNFIAAFWNSPLYGIHLSKKLLGDSYSSNFNSDFGRTDNINEPHEFGYFWRKYLQYKDYLQQTYNPEHKILWDELKEILYQMVYAYEKPVLFKSFLYGFHAQEAVEKMPKTLFIHIKRNLYQNSYSILKLRKKMFGDENIWASMKPFQYEFLKEENIYRQIVGQVMFLNLEYEKQFHNIPDENKLQINYTSLCANTKNVLIDIKDKVENLSNFEVPDFKDIEAAIEVEKEIPDPILSEFKEAEKWLVNNYPELKNA